MEQNSRVNYDLQLMLTDSSAEVLDRARRVLESVYGREGEYSVSALPNILPGPAGKFRRTQANFSFDQKGLFL